jgi:hypothetical protein
VTPALRDSMPPTWESTTTRASSSEVGWGARWSEIAISPTPITSSTIMMSLRMEPVIVAGGMP